MISASPGAGFDFKRGTTANPRPVPRRAGRPTIFLTAMIG